MHEDMRPLAPGFEYDHTSGTLYVSLDTLLADRCNHTDREAALVASALRVRNIFHASMPGDRLVRLVIEMPTQDYSQEGRASA